MLSISALRTIAQAGTSALRARHGLEEYFPAIDSTLAVMKRSGVETITLMGHSTGGLTAAYYMARCPEPRGRPYTQLPFSGLEPR